MFENYYNDIQSAINLLNMFLKLIGINPYFIKQLKIFKKMQFTLSKLFLIWQIILLFIISDNMFNIPNSFYENTFVISINKLFLVYSVILCFIYFHFNKKKIEYFLNKFIEIHIFLISLNISIEYSHCLKYIIKHIILHLLIHFINIIFNENWFLADQIIYFIFNGLFVVILGYIHIFKEFLKFTLSFITAAEIHDISKELKFLKETYKLISELMTGCALMLDFFSFFLLLVIINAYYLTAFIIENIFEYYHYNMLVLNLIELFSYYFIYFYNILSCFYLIMCFDEIVSQVHENNLFIF